MTTVSLVSYALCAVAFAALALLVLIGRRGQGLQGLTLAVILVGACVATALWAGAVAFSLHQGETAGAWSRFFEILRTGLWLLFVTCLLPRWRDNTWQRIFVLAAYALPLAVLALEARDWFLDVSLAGSAYQGLSSMFVLGAIVQAIVGLILLEQYYRGAPADRRWATKHLVLGLGVIFAFDIYLYTSAILAGSVSATAWAARGVIDAFAVPLVALTLARQRVWSQGLFVSRQVAFHTATLTGAGAYLLIMAAGGYYIRALNGTWGEFAQIVFLAAAVVGLLVVLLSGKVRGRLRVFLVKHFFSNKYDYREEWLRLIQALSDDEAEESPHDRAVKAVAQIFDSPCGAMWVAREGEDYVLAGRWRMGRDLPGTVARHTALLDFMEAQQWVVDVDEYRRQPERYEGAPLPAWLDVLDTAWVVMPLLQGQRLFGFLLLCRPNVTAEVTWEDRDLLKTLGRQIAMYVGQHESALALSQARQFEAFNRLTAFIMHDLKNLMAQQSLVVRNAERHKHNPEFVDDAMLTISESVSRMQQLLEHLQRGREPEPVQRVRVGTLVAEVARRSAGRPPAPSVANHLDGEAVVEAAPDALTMVLVHLVRNAQDATGEGGHVEIRVRAHSRGIAIEVVDDGVGMDEAFIRERLFRPFDSTKAAKGMGIGAYQARQLVRELGGEVDVESQPGQGTCFRVILPVVTVENRAEQAQGEWLSGSDETVGRRG